MDCIGYYMVIPWTVYMLQGYYLEYCGYSMNLTWYILYYSRHSFQENLLQSHMSCCGVVKATKSLDESSEKIS